MIETKVIVLDEDDIKEILSKYYKVDIENVTLNYGTDHNEYGDCWNVCNARISIENTVNDNPCIGCRHHTFLRTFDNKKDWMCAYQICKYNRKNLNPLEAENEE